MTTLPDPSRDSTQGDARRSETQKNHLDPVPNRFPLLKTPHVAQAAEGCLESKIEPGGREAIQFVQEQTPCGKCRLFRA